MKVFEAWLAVGLVLVGGAGAGAVEWDGGGDGFSYSDADNWDPAGVPGTGADVVVPGGGFMVTMDVGGGTGAETFSLGAGSTFRLPFAGADYTVNGAALIGGRVEATEGDLTATGAGTVFSGDEAQVVVNFGSEVEIGAPLYSSGGLTSTLTILSASGTGSVLDLSALGSVDAGFDDGSGSQRRHTITATGGGLVDLSGVTTLTPPVRTEDLLEVEVVGAVSTVDLSGLTTIAGGGGRTLFDVTDGAGLELPSVMSVNNAFFDVDGGAALTADGAGGAVYTSTIGTFDLPIMSVRGLGSELDLSSFVSINAAAARHAIAAGDQGALKLPNVTLISNAVLSATGGGVVTVDRAGGVSYSSVGSAFTQTVMSVSGTGSLLDLSGVTGIDAGFSVVSGSSRTHTVQASSGGQIDLSSLTMLMPPVRQQDQLKFVVDGAGSTIDLSSLADTTGGTGRILFEVTGGGVLDLPSAGGLNDVIFIVNGGGELTANTSVGATYATGGLSPGATVMSVNGAGSVLDLSSLVSIDALSSRHVIAAGDSGELKLSGVSSISNSVLSATGGGTVAVNRAGGASYSSTGITFSHTVMSASGTGSTLDLSGVTSIDAGFAGAGANRAHTIRASGGGTIDLSNLTLVTPPVREMDRVEFVVDGLGSSIELGSLGSTVGGMGRTLFGVSDGGAMDLPAVTALHNTLFEITGGGVLSASTTTGATYSSEGLGFNVTVMSVSGLGSELDLGSLGSIVAPVSRHVVMAADHGELKLSGVSTITNATLSATGGGVVTVDRAGGVAYSSAALGFSQPVLTSDGVGSVLDLSGVTSIDAGFDDGNVSTRIHTIRASDGGVIDLSGLTMVTAPVRLEDRLDFIVTGMGSTIELGALTTLPVGVGVTRFSVSGGAVMDLPAIVDWNDVVVDVESGVGTELNLGSVGDGLIRSLSGLGELNNAGLVMVDSGGVFTVGAGVTVVQTGEIEVVNGTLRFDTGVANEGVFDVPVGRRVEFVGAASGSGDYEGGGVFAFLGEWGPGSSAAEVGVTGDVEFGDGTRLVIEMRAGDPGPGVVAGVDFDRVVVTGGVVLDGELGVDFSGVALPELGTVYEVMGFGSRGGTVFDEMTGSLVETSLGFAPLFGATSLGLRATVPGDVNFDDKVSVADLSMFALHFEGSFLLYDDVAGLSSWERGDFNGDGVVTVADLSLLALNFGFGVDGAVVGLPLDVVAGLAGIDTGAVPEPEVLGVVVLGAGLGVARRGRDRVC